MPYEISVEDRKGIFARLSSLFVWTDSLRPRLQGTVVPVVEVIELSGRDRVIQQTLDLQGSAGTEKDVPAFYCPAGKRWVVKAIGKVATTANLTVGAKKDGTVIEFGTGTAIAVVDAYGIELSVNDNVVVYNTGNAGDSSRAVTILVREYDIMN